MYSVRREQKKPRGPSSLRVTVVSRKVRGALKQSSFSTRDGPPNPMLSVRRFTDAPVFTIPDGFRAVSSGEDEEKPMEKRGRLSVIYVALSHENRPRRTLDVALTTVISASRLLPAAR